MPAWELDLWRFAFEVYGPLDWRRLDLLEARACQLQLSKPTKLKDCVLFPAPEDIDDAIKAIKDPQTEEEVLALFGVTTNEGRL